VIRSDRSRFTPNASTFDVRPEVAEKFEMCVGRRDERDPQTMVRE
jgi:hypothetical protein